MKFYGIRLCWYAINTLIYRLVICINEIYMFCSLKNIIDNT